MSCAVEHTTSRAHSSSSPGLSFGKLSQAQTAGPTRSLNKFTYRQPWSEATLRCKIERARIAKLSEQGTYRVYKQ